ncbi:hypothetical protein J5X98_17165 [Leptothermofonsia sichuanensis E412]|uniref:Spy/CpxP family protein refolding chaperone n=1 Tax=Leptothermofonsia sichuanensis TaxID=2917832 RepID=UPI001CA7306A|nr:hypothetical protein [Leptothermofonsia sichuanensis]QZZ19134.1 hypothetical protein J5X98_17165 [Leptothermofonsia sichuanensis E412]
MEKKLSLLVPGAIALILSATPILPSRAQSPDPIPGTRTEKPGPRQGKWGADLNLTEAQKAQMKQIRESTHAQIEAVLTEEQKAQLQSARQQRQANRQQGQTARQPGQKRGGMFANLNLSEEQRTRIRSIREESRRQMDAVLTAEQRQMLQEKRQQMRQRRQSQST